MLILITTSQSRSIRCRRSSGGTICLLAVWCNSNYKRDVFPTDAGGAPQLLNPTVDDPEAHLTFSPTTGRYEAVPNSAKAKPSIKVFGLNRGVLESARRDAWRLYEIGIVAYDAAVSGDDSDQADSIAEILQRLPFAGVLNSLLNCLDDPEAPALGPVCRSALARRPEVAGWLC